MATELYAIRQEWEEEEENEDESFSPEVGIIDDVNEDESFCPDSSM